MSLPLTFFICWAYFFCFQACLPSLLSAVVHLQTAYEKVLGKEKQAREAQEDLEEADGEENEDDEAEAFMAAGHTRMVPAPDQHPDVADSINGGKKDSKKAEAGDDEDVVDERDEEYFNSLRKQRNGGDDGDSDQGSDEGSLFDEPPPEENPLSHISHLLHLEEGLATLARQPGAGQVQAGLPPDVLLALGKMAAAAGQMREQGQKAGVFGLAPEEATAAR